VPLAVRLQAFNPLIPGDADASGLPVAVLRVVLTNEGDVPVTASVCACLQNVIGSDGTTSLPAARTSTFQSGDGLAGLFSRLTSWTRAPRRGGPWRSQPIGSRASPIARPGRS